MAMVKLLLYLHTEEQVKFLKQVWLLPGVESFNKDKKYSIFIDLYSTKAPR